MVLSKNKTLIVGAISVRKKHRCLLPVISCILSIAPLLIKYNLNGGNI